VADKNRPSQGGSRRVTPKSTPSTKGRRIRSRDVLVVALLTAGLLAGLVMAVFGAGGQSDPTTTTSTSTDANGEATSATLPLDDLSLGAIESWSGLEVPDGAEDFLTARMGDSQLDVTFTMPSEDEAAFVAGSGLSEPQPGERQILHSSPLWKLNPGDDDEGTASDTPEADDPSTSEGPIPAVVIRGVADRHDDVLRAVELVDEGPGTVRVRIVLTAA